MRRYDALLEEFVSKISKIVSRKQEKTVKTIQTHPILRCKTEKNKNP